MIEVNIPLDPDLRGEPAKALDASLRRMIVGQDLAIDQIVSAYQMYLSGLTAPSHPIANFLFLGPTGCGKTRIAEATAETLLKTSRALLKIDCAEFQHSHELAKLVGSPPGYLGHRETHPRLSQDVLNQHHTEQTKLSFVLFDEIEKASDALWNLLLGILDKAILTLGDNRKVDFSRTMIFMTSNLGSAEISDILAPRLGFSAMESRRTIVDVHGESMAGRIHRTGVEAARRRFTPEFMNRLDEIVTFRPLGPEQLKKILEIELDLVQRLILSGGSDRAFVFTLSDQAKSFVLDQGTDIRYGARHLKRTIGRLLVSPISNLVSSGQLQAGDLIFVDYDESSQRLCFVKRAEGLLVQAMAYPADVEAITTSMPDARKRRKAAS